MAISAADMTVTITEAVTLNGAARGNTNTYTIGDIHEISERTVTVPITEKTLINMGTGINAGMFIESDVRYIRITNKDANNHITLAFKGENDEEFAIKVDKGQSFIYNADLDNGVVDTMVAASGAVDITSLVDLVNITATANTAACDIEIIVACV